MINKEYLDSINSGLSTDRSELSNNESLLEDLKVFGPFIEKFSFAFGKFINSLQEECETLKLNIQDKERAIKILQKDVLGYAKANGTEPLRPIETEVWSENKDIPLHRTISGSDLNVPKELPLMDEVIGEPYEKGKSIFPNFKNKDVETPFIKDKKGFNLVNVSAINEDIIERSKEIIENSKSNWSHVLNSDTVESIKNGAGVPTDISALGFPPLNMERSDLDVDHWAKEKISQRDKFLTDAEYAFGDTYDYSKVVFNSENGDIMHYPVTIIDKSNGFEISITPHDHLFNDPESKSYINKKTMAEPGIVNVLESEDLFDEIKNIIDKRHGNHSQTAREFLLESYKVDYNERLAETVEEVTKSELYSDEEKKEAERLLETDLVFNLEIQQLQEKLRVARLYGPDSLEAMNLELTQAIDVAVVEGISKMLKVEEDIKKPDLKEQLKELYIKKGELDQFQRDFNDYHKIVIKNKSLDEELEYYRSFFKNMPDHIKEEIKKI